MLHFLVPLFTSQVLRDSARLFLLGTIWEACRRFAYWALDRIILVPSVTVRFQQNDPTYDWIMLFLSQEKIWRKSNNFEAFSKNSVRHWDVLADIDSAGHAAYVPRWETPHMFRWRGYWFEVQQERKAEEKWYAKKESDVLRLTVQLTRDISILPSFVEEARQQYVASQSGKVIVHTASTLDRFPLGLWDGNTIALAKRSLDSVVTDGNQSAELLADVQDFLSMGDWYRRMGIPYHRGYLLYGCPGTGKTSTIYAIAGELGLEIYSLTLSSSNMDDGRLQALAAAIPPRSILLLEDIDCAFPSREDCAGRSSEPKIDAFGAKKTQVTLSGLLNVLDGVGSEGGIITFATTNYVDRLDPALSRPGRMDIKVEYKLASTSQARKLFRRFFPAPCAELDRSCDSSDKTASDELADAFARGLPAHEFSTAQIQGYLLRNRHSPDIAVEQLHLWVQEERQARRKSESTERCDGIIEPVDAALGLKLGLATPECSPRTPPTPPSHDE